MCYWHAGCVWPCGLLVVVAVVVGVAAAVGCQLHNCRTVAQHNNGLNFDLESLACISYSYSSMCYLNWGTATLYFGNELLIVKK